MDGGDRVIENKYHFAREVIYELRTCHAITEKVYLHWLDKLIEDERDDEELKKVEE